MTSSVTDSEVLTTAEIEARKRRERILQLKRKAQKKPENPDGEPQELLEEPPLKVSAVVENEDSETVDDDSEAVDDDSRSLISQRTTELEAESEELDLSKLASRKVDWDLKRGIEKSLAILQDRTNEVIAEIVQESLGSDEEVED